MCKTVTVCLFKAADHMQRTCTVYTERVQRRYDMNGISQMQGDQNWIFSEKDNCKLFFWDSHWLEIWKKHLHTVYPSMGPNRGNVAMHHKVRTYKEYHSVCPSSELGLPPTPQPQATGEKGVGRVPIPTRGIHYGTLYMYVLCAIV